jgi:photosystem II stability/assembly factor-like uncharacterized protein
MKTFLLALTILLSSSKVFAQQPLVTNWQRVATIDYTSVARQSTTTLVATSTHGYLYYTRDNGDTWIPQRIGDSLVLTSISFADSLNGMLLDNRTRLLVTTDGGGTWVLRAAELIGREGLTNNTFFLAEEAHTTVKYLALDNAIIADYQGALWRSTDGGNSWSKKRDGTKAFDHWLGVASIYFRPNEIDGYAFKRGVPALRTSDGGETWTEVEVGSGDSISLLTADFWNDQRGAIAGWGHIYFTTDGGTTWRDKRLPDEIYSYLTAIKFLGMNSFVAMGPAGQVYYSEDFGQTINLVLMEPGFQIGMVRSAEMTSDGVLFVGEGGVVYRARSTKEWQVLHEVSYEITDFQVHKDGRWQYVAGGNFIGTSTDSGATWEYAELPEQIQTILPAFHTIHFTDENSGILLSEEWPKQGMETSDAGRTWAPISITSNAGTQIKEVRFGSSYSGYGIGGGGIMRTTDAGRTWFKSATFPTTNPWKLWALDSLTAFTAEIVFEPKRYHKVFATSDGGETWRELGAPKITYLHDIYFPTKDIGFLSADAGSVYRTTDAGITWTAMQMGPTYTNMRWVRFATSSVGFAAMMDTNALFVTTDAGATWTSVAFPHVVADERFQTNHTLTHIFFPDTNTIFAAGQMILGTFMSSMLDYKAFYRATINHPQGTQANRRAIARDDELRIYPANASDKILIDFDKVQNRTITIYDALGREVARQRSEGTQNTILIGELPSGRYLIQAVSKDEIRSGRFVVTR